MYEAPKPDPNVAAKPRVNRSPGQPQRHTVDRLPLDQPQPQPKASQPQPKVKRSASPPQRQRRAERQAPQPRSNVAGGIEAGKRPGQGEGQRQTIGVTDSSLEGAKPPETPLCS